MRCGGALFMTIKVAYPSAPGKGAAREGCIQSIKLALLQAVETTPKSIIG